MVLTVTEDTPADMLAGSMELLVQLPRENHLQTQRVTVQRSTPMMDLLVQIATAHKLPASSYTLQAIGERGMVLPHQPNTPIGALDALQVKLLPKQGTLMPRKAKQANQPFETTFRLQVHLPRNQLYVSRVSPKMNLGEILDEVCREKNLDKNKYELRHPGNLETLDLSLSLQDYHLQEVTLYAKQGRTLGSGLSTQDIMVLQRQEERRRQQAKQGVFSFVFKKSKEGSLSTDSLGGRSASPARSDETGRSTSPLQPPARPQRKRRPAPKPPTQAQPEVSNSVDENSGDPEKDKVVISHSRNSSDSSGYHEASVLSDNPDSAGRLPETLPRRNKAPLEIPRKLAHTSQSSKSLCNLASVSGRKKRTAPPPPVTRPLSSAISTQALERIVDSEESLTSDMDPSKPPSDIGAPSKANSDIEDRPKASSDIGVTTLGSKISSSIDFTKEPEPERKNDLERQRSGSVNVKLSTEQDRPVDDVPVDARVSRKRVGEPAPLPKPRKRSTTQRPEVPRRKIAPPSPSSRTLSSESSNVDRLSNAPSPVARSESIERSSVRSDEKLEVVSCYSTSEEEFFTPGPDQSQEVFNYDSIILKEKTEAMKNEDVKCEKELEEGSIEKSENTSLIENKNCNQTVKITKEESNSDKDYNSIILEEKTELIKNKDVKCEKELSTERNTQNSENPSWIKNKNCNQAVRKISKRESSTDEEDSSLPSDGVQSVKEKRVCAVISTMPKCDHLNELSMDDAVRVQREQNKEGFKEPRKARIPRTASKSNDFETNSLEKQKRHLTSHAEDITFALNLNVASAIALPRESDSEDTPPGHAVGSPDNFSKTDALLQKVSDTLSSSLPETSVSPTEVRKVEPSKEEAEAEKKKKSIVCPEESRINSSTPNLTVSSQQDTSDYVSAADEDLSAVEWEYQLPAPPSAFRDSQSPVFDKFEAPEEPKPIETSNDKDRRKTSEKPEIRDTKVNEIQKDTPQEKSLKQQKSELNLKKEVISELENKIGTLPQSSKELDSKKAINHPSTPKIAPVDNTLSNFTITTYSRQKNLNIFEEVQEQSRAKNDDRFIKSFATLARNRSNSNDNEDRTEKEFDVGTLQGKKRVEEDGKKLEPKIQPEPLQRWQNEKSNVQRSKSSVSEKPVLKLNVKEILKTEKDSEDGEQEDKKRSNEKFSQWRENILKRQENPTKEKQLQSIQVMKSILPQLKNAQQAEENVPKESIDTVLIEKTRSETASNDHSTESNVVPTREPNKLEAEMRKPSVENKAKRYTYSGPPTINLGSWSERPTANVQIKMDTDYKFGIKPINNNNNNRTVININTTSKDEVDASNIESSVKQRADVPSNELTKKLITHTTATGFKRPVLNKINPEPRKSNDKPIVTGVELKKGFAENKDDDVIDTSPLNFKELTKAFGQDVCLRPKSKRSNTIHRSDSNLENDSRKQNGCVNTDALTNGHQEKPRRFTSVVGIQAPGTLLFRNGLAAKGPVPVVKGFKIPTAREEQSNSKVDVSKEPKVPQPPRPPTMPVITGVTLKSARPKSMPVQTDRRDVLLESIRNFGGRENLKSASGIYRT
ncbi:cordon-bleu protein-like 1 isoform X2 [Ceratina calcarata]|uniref:Cordon-bleu protein-like 1 isoform X2 n=1 Tax=Ceratina calcarata TaxID=156304 RepID=A0AAJ7J1Q4_9HYME|nr:cordon-bleu protein-like 1 isoform X2 [Ceratina calcarata]